MEIKRGLELILEKNLGLEHGRGRDEFYYEGELDHYKLGQRVEVIEQVAEDKLVVRAEKNCGSCTCHKAIAVHPEEVGLGQPKKIALQQMPGLAEVDQHPLFEFAESNPLFIVGGEVYTPTKGKATGSFYRPNQWRQPLVVLGTLTSLDELASHRQHFQIQEVQTAYALEQIKKITNSDAHGGNLDLPQRIYKLVFPHLRSENYENKLALLIHGKAPSPQKAKGEVKSNGEVQRIAQTLYNQVQEMITQIEQEGNVPKQERTKIKSKLDGLLDYQEPEIVADSPLTRALKGTSVALIRGEIYDLHPTDETTQLQINNQNYKLVLRKTEPKQKAEFEVGDQIVMNKRATKKYRYTHEGSRGKIIAETGNGKYRVRFTLQTGDPQGGTTTWKVHEDYMTNVTPNEPFIETIETLENQVLLEQSRDLRISALREHITPQDIASLIKDEHTALLTLKDKKEYAEDNFGFLTRSRDTYVYLEVPAFAIKSQFDGNYYLFDKARIGFQVYSDGSSINYSERLVMIDNNNHPFNHNERGSWVKICIGRQSFPTSGKDRGEVIAKRLRRGQEMLMYGYTSRDYQRCYELRKECYSCGRNHFSQNLTTEAKVKSLGVPIINGGPRR